MRRRPAAYVALAAALVGATLGSAGASARRAVLPQPKLRAIRAVFKPSPQGKPCAPPYCTTIYTERATGEQLSYRWKVRIPVDPECARGFTGNKPSPNKATWYHADASEGGYCNHSGTDYDAAGGGHPGRVTVRVTNADWICSAKFTGTQGSRAERVSLGLLPKCHKR